MKMALVKKCVNYEKYSEIYNNTSRSAYHLKNNTSG